MYKIFTLDDQEKNNVLLKQIIEIINGKLSINLTIEEQTTNVHEFLQLLPRQVDSQVIYFLDIELEDKLDGIQIGKQIREMNPQAKIIYLTSHLKYMKTVIDYYISPIAYIEKKSLEEMVVQIQRALEQIIKLDAVTDNSSQNDALIINKNRQYYKMAYKNIVSIEYVSNHKLKLTTADTILEFTGTLSDFCAINENLIQVHRGFIININQIASYLSPKNIVIMKNGKEIPIGRKYKQVLNERYKKSTAIR